MKRRFTVVMMVLAVFLALGACELKEAENTEYLYLYYDRETELYGYIDREATWVIPPIYEYGTQFSEGLAYVKTADDVGGYINSQGEMVFTFECVPFFAEQFSHGVAVVDNGRRPTYLINNRGEKTSSRFSMIQGMSEGLAAFSIRRTPRYYSASEKFSYMNEEGKRATEKEFDEADSFSNGYAAVAIHSGIGEDRHHDYKWGLINKDFELVVDFIYDDMGMYSHGLVPVKMGEKWGYIDAQGEIVLPFQYEVTFTEFLGSESYKMNQFRYGSSYYGVVRHDYQKYSHSFSEGLASVYLDGKGGYIDTTGNWVIPPEYDQVRPFSEGLAAVRRGKLWGFVNTQGEIVIPIQYNHVLDCVNGLIVVGDEEGKFLCYIDKTGKMITPLPPTNQPI